MHAIRRDLTTPTGFPAASTASCMLAVVIEKQPGQWDHVWRALCPLVIVKRCYGRRRDRQYNTIQYNSLHHTHRAMLTAARRPDIHRVPHNLHFTSLHTHNLSLAGSDPFIGPRSGVCRISRHHYEAPSSRGCRIPPRILFWSDATRRSQADSNPGPPGEVTITPLHHEWRSGVMVNYTDRNPGP